MYSLLELIDLDHSFSVRFLRQGVSKVGSVGVRCWRVRLTPRGSGSARRQDRRGQHLDDLEKRNR